MMASSALLFRYRLALGAFIVGLLISGITAFPLLVEVRLLAHALGIDSPEQYAAFNGLHRWIAQVLLGLEQVHRAFPFLAYGTDWLAFGHLCLAVFFIRPLFHPLESDWVLRCGLICCAGVIPLALIAGELRGVPAFWRLVDCSFGVFGAVPLGYCLRLSRQLRSA